MERRCFHCKHGPNKADRKNHFVSVQHGQKAISMNPGCARWSTFKLVIPIRCHIKRSERERESICIDPTLCIALYVFVVLFLVAALHSDWFDFVEGKNKSILILNVTHTYFLLFIS